MNPVDITLIGKPGCPLCAEAREVIAQVREDLARDGIATNLVEYNILEDEQLARLHAEDIPVVKIGERRHSIWRVEPDKFAAAVRKAAKPSLFARLGR